MGGVWGTRGGEMIKTQPLTDGTVGLPVASFSALLFRPARGDLANGHQGVGRISTQFSPQQHRSAGKECEKEGYQCCNANLGHLRFHNASFSYNVSGSKLSIGMIF